MNLKQNLVSSLPLVVDLDGTLIATDTLFESANQFVWSKPFSLVSLFRWLAKGKAFLKSKLAASVTISPETLPYRQEVLDFVAEEKNKGRVVVLATASSEVYAREIAQHLNIFSEVLASNESINLKGVNKRDTLISLYGDGGFDYVGDSQADISIWEHAHLSFMIQPKKAWVKRVSRTSSPVELKLDSPNRLLTLNKTIRMHQWVKNLLIFLPLLVTHQLFSPFELAKGMLAFMAFSLAASSIYVVNDLVDLPNDRLHKTKRNRAIASGRTSILIGWVIWPSLLAVSLAISFILLSLEFGLIILTYIGLTTIYSLKLKKIAVLDVVTLALLYTTRIIAGAIAINTVPSFWILSFSLFFFFSLALMKRFSELLEMKSSGKNQVIHGRGYSSEDLELVSALGAGSGLISVLVFLLYIHDPAIASLYNNPLILWVCGVILLVWISRAWLIAHRGLMHEDPIVFALKDKVSYFLAASIGLLFFLAMVN